MKKVKVYQDPITREKVEGTARRQFAEDPTIEPGNCKSTSTQDGAIAAPTSTGGRTTNDAAPLRPGLDVRAHGLPQPVESVQPRDARTLGVQARLRLWNRDD